MHTIYYTIGLIICLPYIFYITIKNNGDLIKTIDHLTTTWKNTTKENIDDNQDIQYKIRFALFFLFIALALVGIKYIKVFYIVLATIFILFIIYYIINPKGVVMHIIFQIKQLYPLQNKVNKK
ncbi:MAG: hypothetical protein JL50_00745 [Peptococcaceae bacterium BICA1-7]|nr:MAG: hypothetical protein JL50_00745 [Peptococcaceae bacterium BICA1-7]HBV98084.1 hypothetical protein [Desulfotomaculum sp.]